MNTRKIDFEELPWERPAPGVRAKSLRDSGRQLRVVELTRDFVEPEWCEKGHLGIVLQGELEIDFRGRLVRYPVGSGICISSGPGNGHKARAVTPIVRLFLVEEG